MKSGMLISQRIHEIRLALRAFPLPYVFLCLFVPLGLGSFLAGLTVAGLEPTGLSAARILFAARIGFAGAAAIAAVGTLLEYVQRIKS
ncbi:hypothetical protein H9Q10_05180 [Eikenella sp. S3360]|uniref:Uncharacterized protein n=1 Tax=Eikenella glucosivorans TaxID=2766967 RepID=A0ABS0N9W1_9NEIS|nr:hypothetical protein [Eikenella glucosivorans]MBH5329060.1 hypothetical protein [Eikenella glucosivorans]